MGNRMSTLADLERVERELRDDASPHLGDGWSLHRKRQADTIAAFIAEHGWQPIETAPRDGAFVLVWNGYWISAAKYWEPYDGTYRRGWVSETTELLELIEPQPTHWMPLPAAPSGTKENSDG